MGVALQHKLDQVGALRGHGMVGDIKTAIEESSANAACQPKVGADCPSRVESKGGTNTSEMVLLEMANCDGRICHLEAKVLDVLVLSNICSFESDKGTDRIAEEHLSHLEIDR